MKITKEQTKKFKSFDAFLEKKIGKEEKASLEKEAENYLLVLKEMQDVISAEVAKYMAKEGIGFNEMTRRMDTSSRQTTRIIKGEANITLETLAELAFVIGKHPHITFK